MFERTTAPTGHVRPPQETSVKAREFLARWGERVAAEASGVSPPTFIRVAAGSTVQACVLDAIQRGMSRPEADLHHFANKFSRRIHAK